MMIRLFLLFVLAGMNFMVCGQDSINHTDASGRKQGIWRKLDKDGHKLYDGQFKDGIPYGTFRYYYANGNLKTISILSDEGKTARTVSYAINGKKIAEGNYRNERKDSTWKYFSDYDGILLSEETYSSGIETGVSKTFYPNGNIAEVISYREGKKEGEWIQYYDDGKVRFKGTYVNDDKEGPFTGYFPDGKVNLSGGYKSGHKDGKWTIYGDKGEILNSERYSEGALIEDKSR